MTSCAYIGRQNGKFSEHKDKKVRAIAAGKLLQFSKDLEGFFERNFDMLQWIYVRSLYKNLKRIWKLFSLLKQPKQVFQSKSTVFSASEKEPIFNPCILKSEKSKYCNGSRELPAERVPSKSLS